LAVKPNYFSRGYVSQPQWVNYWQESLNVSYTPVVDVKVVKPNPNYKHDPLGLEQAIIHTAKYCVKHTDMIVNQDWLIELTTQLHGTKHIVLGGLLKKYVNSSEPKEDDILNGATDNDELEPDDEFDKLLFFHWKSRQNYFLSNR